MSWSAPPALTKGRQGVFQASAALHRSAWAESCYRGAVSLFVAVGKKKAEVQRE